MLQVPAFRHEDDYWVAEHDGMTSRARMAEASGAFARRILGVLDHFAQSLIRA